MTKSVIINCWKSLGATQKDALYNFLTYEKEGYLIQFIKNEDRVYFEIPEEMQLLFLVNKIYTDFMGN